MYQFPSWVFWNYCSKRIAENYFLIFFSFNFFQSGKMRALYIAGFCDCRNWSEVFDLNFESEIKKQIEKKFKKSNQTFTECNSKWKT